MRLPGCMWVEAEIDCLFHSGFTFLHALKCVPCLLLGAERILSDKKPVGRILCPDSVIVHEPAENVCCIMLLK